MSSKNCQHWFPISVTRVSKRALLAGRHLHCLCLDGLWMGPGGLPQGCRTLCALWPASFLGTRGSDHCYALEAPPERSVSCVRTHTLSLTFLSALVFPSPTYLLISFSHTKPSLHSCFPPHPLPRLLYFTMQGLWWGNSLESLFHAQKCVFYPIHISCSSHLIFWRFLIPDITRRIHCFLMGIVFSTDLPLLLSMWVVLLVMYLLSSKKDFSILELMLPDDIDLEWSQGMDDIVGGDLVTEDTVLDSHSCCHLYSLVGQVSICEMGRSIPHGLVRPPHLALVVFFFLSINRWFKLCLTYYERTFWEETGPPTKTQKRLKNQSWLRQTTAGLGSWEQSPRLCLQALWEGGRANGWQWFSSQLKVQIVGREHGIASTWVTCPRKKRGILTISFIKIPSNEGKGFPKVRSFQKKGHSFWVGGATYSHSTAQTAGR